MCLIFLAMEIVCRNLYFFFSSELEYFRARTLPPHRRTDGGSPEFQRSKVRRIRTRRPQPSVAAVGLGAEARADPDGAADSAGQPAWRTCQERGDHSRALGGRDQR